MTRLINARVTGMTANEFDSAVEAGVFGERRVFLWGGRICEKRPKTTAHAFVSARVSHALRPLIPEGWEPWHGNPIRLGRKYVAYPDFAIVRGPLARYLAAAPGPKEVGMIVEVAVAGLSAGLGPIVAQYARAGVACYWVADALGKRVIEHRGPQVIGNVASYATVEERAVGDEIELTLGGVAVGRVALADIF
jgi:hypothetical protein